MNCHKCNNKAINTTVTHYHDGGGAIGFFYSCADHTPEDHTDVIGRKVRTIWGEVLTNNYHRHNGAKIVKSPGFCLDYCDNCREWSTVYEQNYDYVCPFCGEGLY